MSNGVKTYVVRLDRACMDGQRYRLSPGPSAATVLTQSQSRSATGSILKISAPFE